MVYGWTMMTRKGQIRAIMKTRSRAAVVRALHELGYTNVSDYYLKNYGSDTGNESELVAAEAAGEGVVLFRYLNDFKGEYKRLEAIR